MLIFQNRDDKILHIEEDNTKSFIEAENTKIVLAFLQRYTYRVLQTIQMKLILLCVWAEPAILGSAKIQI